LRVGEKEHDSGALAQGSHAAVFRTVLGWSAVDIYSGGGPVPHTQSMGLRRILLVVVAAVIASAAVGEPSPLPMKSYLRAPYHSPRNGDEIDAPKTHSPRNGDEIDAPKTHSPRNVSKHVEFHQWSSSTFVNMCSCEGPPDSVLYLSDAECQAVQAYRGPNQPRRQTLPDAVAGDGIRINVKDARKEVFVKASCTPGGNDVHVHIFKDKNCTKRVLRYSSTWKHQAKPFTCDRSKALTNVFGSPVPTCASLFRCVGYGRGQNGSQ